MFDSFASSSQVSFDDIDQLLSGPGLFRPGILVGVNNMEPDMAIEHLSHERVDRAPAGGNCVQNLRTIRSSFDCVLDRLNLAADPADAIEQFLLISKYVSQKAPPEYNSIPGLVYNVC